MSELELLITKIKDKMDAAYDSMCLYADMGIEDMRIYFNGVYCALRDILKEC